MEAISERDGTSMNQFLVVAAAEKIAAMQAETFFTERAARAARSAASGRRDRGTRASVDHARSANRCAGLGRNATPGRPVPDHAVRRGLPGGRAAPAAAVGDAGRQAGARGGDGGGGCSGGGGLTRRSADVGSGHGTTNPGNDARWIIACGWYYHECRATLDIGRLRCRLWPYIPGAASRCGT